MKIIKLILLFLTVSVTACKETGTTDADTTTDDTVTFDNEQESSMSARERDFVDDVIEDNNDEIAWLNAAIKSGTDAELKSQAQQMLTDHEKMHSDMKAFAAKHAIEIEEVDTTAVILDINEDDPADWDEEWSDEMADKHRRLIRRFERAENYVDDAELKALVTGALPTLRSHLDMATKLEEKLDKKGK
jgi:putative membrane protein